MNSVVDSKWNGIRTQVQNHPPGSLIASFVNDRNYDSSGKLTAQNSTEKQRKVE